MDNVSAGEVGGIFAGLTAVAAVVGKMVASIVSWDKDQRRSKEERLSKWEENLVKREREYREEIEGQLEQVRADLHIAKGIATELNHTVSTLVIAVEDLTSELESHAPKAASLMRARRLLQSLHVRPTPPDLAMMADTIDAANADAAPIPT